MQRKSAAVLQERDIANVFVSVSSDSCSMSVLRPSCVSLKTYRPHRLNYGGKTTVNGSTVDRAASHSAVGPFCTITASEIKAQ